MTRSSETPGRSAMRWDRILDAIDGLLVSLYDVNEARGYEYRRDFGQSPDDYVIEGARLLLRKARERIANVWCRTSDYVDQLEMGRQSARAVKGGPTRAKAKAAGG